MFTIVILTVLFAALTENFNSNNIAVAEDDIPSEVLHLKKEIVASS